MAGRLGRGEEGFPTHNNCVPWLESLYFIAHLMNNSDKLMARDKSSRDLLVPTVPMKIATT
jgi:hypothetical protein